MCSIGKVQVPDRSFLKQNVFHKIESMSQFANRRNVFVRSGTTLQLDAVVQKVKKLSKHLKFAGIKV